MNSSLAYVVTGDTSIPTDIPIVARANALDIPKHSHLTVDFSINTPRSDVFTSLTGGLTFSGNSLQ